MASIHLAEDDPSLRTLLSKALGKAGHMVTSREDAVEAIAALKPGDYDLLVVTASNWSSVRSRICQGAIHHLFRRRSKECAKKPAPTAMP